MILVRGTMEAALGGNKARAARELVHPRGML